MRWIIYNAQTGQFGITSYPAEFQGNPNIIVVGPEDAATRQTANGPMVDMAYLNDKLKIDTAFRLKEMDINQYQAETQRLNTLYSNYNSQSSNAVAGYNAETNRMQQMGQFALEAGRPENWAFYANNAIAGKGSAMKFLSGLSGGRALPGVVNSKSLNPYTPKEFMSDVWSNVGPAGGSSVSVSGGGGGSGVGVNVDGQGMNFTDPNAPNFVSPANKRNNGIFLPMGAGTTMTAGTPLPDVGDMGAPGAEDHDFTGYGYNRMGADDPIGNPRRYLQTLAQKYPNLITKPIDSAGNIVGNYWNPDGSPINVDGRYWPRMPTNEQEAFEFEQWVANGMQGKVAYDNGQDASATGGQTAGGTGTGAPPTPTTPKGTTSGTWAGRPFTATTNPDGTVTVDVGGTKATYQSQAAFEAAFKTHGGGNPAVAAAGSLQDFANRGQPVPDSTVTWNGQRMTAKYDPNTGRFSYADNRGGMYNQEGSIYTDQQGTQHKVHRSRDPNDGKYDNPGNDVDDDPERDDRRDAAEGGAFGPHNQLPSIEDLGPGAHADIIKHPKVVDMNGEQVNTGEPDADNPDGADELHIVIPLQGNKPVTPWAAKLANDAINGSQYSPTQIPPNQLSGMAQRAGMAGGGINLPNTGPHIPATPNPDRPIYPGPEGGYMPLVPEMPVWNDSPRARHQAMLIAQPSTNFGMAGGGVVTPQPSPVPEGGPSGMFNNQAILDTSQVDDQRGQPACPEGYMMFEGQCMPYDVQSAGPPLDRNGNRCLEDQFLDPGTQMCMNADDYIVQGTQTESHLPGMAEGGIGYGYNPEAVLSPGAKVDIGNKPYDAMKEITGSSKSKNPYDALVAPKEPMYINKGGMTNVITGGAGKVDKKTGVYTPKYAEISAAKNIPYIDALSMPASKAEDIMRTPLQRAMYESIMKEIGEDWESYWARFAYALPGGNVPTATARRRGFG